MDIFLAVITVLVVSVAVLELIASLKKRRWGENR